MKSYVKLYLSIVVVALAVVCLNGIVYFMNRQDDLSFFLAAIMLPLPILTMVILVYKICTYKYPAEVPKENPEAPKGETGTKE